jgi:hypothetical protein
MTELPAPDLSAGEITTHALEIKAGGEPGSIGWVCGTALAWHFMGADILNWVRLAFLPEMPVPPSLGGSETLVTVLLSMLGLGGLRTVEKIKGVARER